MTIAEPLQRGKTEKNGSNFFRVMGGGEKSGPDLSVLWRSRFSAKFPRTMDVNNREKATAIAPPARKDRVQP
jgi:hypothetical protein